MLSSWHPRCCKILPGLLLSPTPMRKLMHLLFFWQPRGHATMATPIIFTSARWRMVVSVTCAAASTHSMRSTFWNAPFSNSYSINAGSMMSKWTNTFGGTVKISAYNSSFVHLLVFFHISFPVVTPRLCSFVWFWVSLSLSARVLLFFCCTYALACYIYTLVHT